MVTVVDMLIVAAMIGYEALTQAHHEAQERLPVPQVPVAAKGVSVRVRKLEEMEPDDLPPLVTTPKPRLISSQSEPFGSVFAISAAVLEADQGRLDFLDLRAAYVKVCQRQGKKPRGFGLALSQQFGKPEPFAWCRCSPQRSRSPPGRSMPSRTPYWRPCRALRTLCEARAR